MEESISDFSSLDFSSFNRVGDEERFEFVWNDYLLAKTTRVVVLVEEEYGFVTYVNEPVKDGFISLYGMDYEFLGKVPVKKIVELREMSTDLIYYRRGGQAFKLYKFLKGKKFDDEVEIKVEEGGIISGWMGDSIEGGVVLPFIFRSGDSVIVSLEEIISISRGDELIWLRN